MGQDCTIRVAEESDARGIAEVHVASWQAAYPHIFPEAFLASLSVTDREEMWKKGLASSNGPIFVLEKEGRIVGFGSYGIPQDEDLKEDPKTMELYALYFLGSSVGQGYGSRLMKYAEEQLSPHRISVWVLDANEGARAFYAKRGFRQEEGQRKDYVVNGVAYDALRYIKSLV